MKGKLKILIIGHARHGKDTVAEMIRDEYGYSFQSSSEAALDIFLFDHLNDHHKKGYKTKEEAFEDRKSEVNRAIWYNEICTYNFDDKARLAKGIMKNNDIYVGMRSDVEAQECIDQGVFDLIIGVYNPRKPLEPKASFNIDLFEKSDIIIPNTGRLEDLKGKVSRLNLSKHIPNPKIGLDIDEVLADWVGHWTRYFGQEIPSSWVFDRDIGAKFESLKDDKDFWMSIPAKVNHYEIPFEPHCYITSRSIPKEWTEEWLDRNGFPAAKVHSVGLGESKLDVAKSSGIDVFVDDKFDTFVELNNAGIDCYLFDAHHNQRYDVGNKRIYSLRELTQK